MRLGQCILEGPASQKCPAESRSNVIGAEQVATAAAPGLQLRPQSALVSGYRILLGIPCNADTADRDKSKRKCPRGCGTFKKNVDVGGATCCATQTQATRHSTPGNQLPRCRIKQKGAARRTNVGYLPKVNKRDKSLV